MGASSARLRVLFPPGVDRTVLIDRDPFIIGRRPDCDLVIDAHDVSRVQAAIRRDGHGFVLEDSGSAFGTAVNGVPAVSHVLHNRDSVTLGKDRQIEIVFLHDDPMSTILRRVDSRPPLGASPGVYRNLALLLEIGNGLNSMTSLQDILELALDAVVDVTGADRGFLVLRDHDGELRMRAARKIDRANLEGDSLLFSHSIVEEVFRTGEPRYVMDTATDTRARARRSIAELALRAVLCVPIRALPSMAATRPDRRSGEGAVMGVIYADSARATGPIADTDRDLITSIAAQAALALDNFYLRQEELERRLGEREMEREMERLRELDRIKSEFLSNVSHELRTPLTALKGSIDNMLDGLTGEVPDQQRRYLSRMNENADQLHRLINDLLDLARMEAGRLSLHPRSTSVTRLIEDAAESLRSMADRRGVTIRSEPLAEDVVILADRDRLMQVLFNLISNALKFTPAGGSVTVSAAREGDSVRFSVTDTGSGIPEQDLERIFDRFYQAPAADGSKPVGTGLGLPISRSLVEIHGGRLWAERVAGGSRLSFSLPIPAAPRAAEEGAGK